MFIYVLLYEKFFSYISRDVAKKKEIGVILVIRDILRGGVGRNRLRRNVITLFIATP